MPTVSFSRIYHPGPLMEFFVKHGLPFDVGRPIDGPDLVGYFIRTPAQYDLSSLAELKGSLRSWLGVKQIYIVVGLEPGELAILAPPHQTADARVEFQSHIPVGLHDTVAVDAHQVIEQWIKEIDEFHTMSYLSQRSLARLYGGPMDNRDYDTFEIEQEGCAAAMRILRELAIPGRLTEGELQYLAVDALVQNGPRHPRRKAVHIKGIQWAIDVVRGCAEKHYTRFHIKHPGPKYP